MKHTEEQIAQVEAWLVDMVRRGWVKSAGKDLWEVTPLGTRVLPPIVGLIYGLLHAAGVEGFEEE